METQNQQTVVGVFDDYNAAQDAQSELIRVGIPRESINVTRDSSSGMVEGKTVEGNHEDGFTGWLHRIFGSDDDAAERSHYSEAVRRGDVILSATVPESQVSAAVDVMDHFGATNIDQRVEKWKQSEYDAGNTAVPVIEEDLEVGKRSVQRGGVRVYSRMVTQPVEEQISLREEQVRVERRPVDRPLTDEDLRLQDQTIEVTEMAEVPVVTKRARVVEEVTVGKGVSERTETIQDSVRRTEVEVDELADESTQSRIKK